jgi:hypothetical protein
MSKRDLENNSFFINIEDDKDKGKNDDNDVIDIFDFKKTEKKAKSKKKSEKKHEIDIQTITKEAEKKKTKVKPQKKEKTKAPKKDIDVKTESRKVKYKYSGTKHIKRNWIRNINRKKRDKKTELTVLLIYGVVVFLVCSLLITRYSYICKTDRELDAIQNDIGELSSQIEAKTLELSLIDDIGKIENIAKGNLKMYYPNNNQIRYIEIGNISE